MSRASSFVDAEVIKKLVHVLSDLRAANCISTWLCRGMGEEKESRLQKGKRLSLLWRLALTVGIDQKLLS